MATYGLSFQTGEKWGNAMAFYKIFIYEKIYIQCKILYFYLIAFLYLESNEDVFM